jgi:hypothetical protein
MPLDFPCQALKFALSQRQRLPVIDGLGNSKQKLILHPEQQISRWAADSEWRSGHAVCRAPSLLSFMDVLAPKNTNRLAPTYRFQRVRK